MYHQPILRLITGLFVLLLQSVGPVAAQDGINLQVSGAVEAADFSLEDLDAMAQTTFETTTIWTDDVTTFSGVSLRALLDAGNATGNAVEMIALNDYAVTMPIAEIGANAPIVATRMNGEPMSVRDKGPYWVVFPYDSDTQYQSEIVYSRSIWQLNRLVVIEE